MFLLDALSGRSRTSLAENVLHALRAIGASLVPTRVVDPANTNNILSDDLSKAEKEHIAALAARSAAQQSWGDIIW